MYKVSFSGDPYKAGYKYGDISYKRNTRIIDKIEVSEEDYSLGEKNINIYKEYYPEILVEIKGLAEGQKLIYEELASFIFSSPSLNHDDKSFCFAICDENNIILGRNENIIGGSNGLHKNCFYNLHGGYSFIGNTASLVQMGDGVNEWGLSIGLSPISSKLSKPGFNGGMLVRYLLEKCKSTYEALEMVKALPIGSRQGLLIVDILGDGLLLECSSEKVCEVTFDLNEPILLSANIFNSQAMRRHRSKGAEGILLKDRYEQLKSILRRDKENPQEFPFKFLTETQDFMSEFSKDKKYETLWSSIYDLKKRKIYRCEGNLQKNKYKEDYRLRALYNSIR